MGLYDLPTTFASASLPILFYTLIVKYIGVMKYQSSINFTLPPSILICFSAMVACIFFVKWIIELFKLNAYDFDALDIIRVAVGMSLTSLLKILSKKNINNNCSVWIYDSIG